MLENVERGIFMIPFRLADRAEPVRRLISKYADVPAALADACLIDMASELRTGRILTLDGDFKIYLASHASFELGKKDEKEPTMFTLNDMRALLNARPFVPFRLWLSDGGHVDVRSPEFVLPIKHFALIGLPDPNAADSSFDRYMTVWYLHVTRHEMLSPGTPPFTPPPGPAGSPSPSQV